MIERFCGRDFKHPGHRWISSRVQYQCGGLGNDPKPAVTAYWYVMGPTMPAQFGRGYATKEGAEAALGSMVAGLKPMGVDISDYTVKQGLIYS
jgi:hypothetical protein